jgi:hypothetical protein
MKIRFFDAIISTAPGTQSLYDAFRTLPCLIPAKFSVDRTRRTLPFFYMKKTKSGFRRSWKCSVKSAKRWDTLSDWPSWRAETGGNLCSGPAQPPGNIQSQPFQTYDHALT